MSEVKKPKALRLSDRLRVKCSIMAFGRATRVPCCEVVDDRSIPELTPEQARRLARWLEDYSAWAKSLEPEFDERNE